jgi:hypothetical protein
MALNPFQQSVSDLARSLGLRGQAEQQVYQRPEFQQLITQQLGNIPLPAGIDESMVVSRTPQLVEYRDAEGFVHRLERNLDARDQAQFGKVSETSTNRPAILPLTQQNNPAVPTNEQQTNLTQTLTNSLANPVALSQLDPQAQAQLQQIFQAQNALQEDQFQKAQGSNIAQLVGSGLGASSIAGQQLNQLLQGQSLARGQQQANQNQTQLGVQQFLTGQQGQQNQNLQQFIQNLLGLGTQRDIASGQLGLQQQQLTSQNNLAYDQLFQQQLQIEEQQRQAERQAMWNNIFRGVAAGTGIASGLAGGGGLGSLFGGGSPNNARNVLGITGG